MVINKKIAIGVGFVILIIFLLIILKTLPIFWGVFIDKKINVKKSENGNINILLLGIGGAKHDGPDLTDTIILASINPQKNIVHLVSIPRDLYVDSLQSKINAAYANGQEKGGKGILLARSTVASITGIRPDYVFVLDFSGFIKLVDLIGGIDVPVQNTLDDYAYPEEGKENELCGVTDDGLASFSAQIATGSATEFDLFPCRFLHLHVPAGVQHMDGELALKFVRSRHALGQEGSDFARSKRQQLVINAVRDKILSLGTLANPVKLIGIVGILGDNIRTDIPEGQFDDFIKLAQKMKGAKIESTVIDEGDLGQERYGLLINPPLQEYNGQWVLAPRAGRGNYSEIKTYLSCVLKGGKCLITKDSVEIVKAPPSVTPSSHK
ncbi:MAG TPA: LCP family protein [Candidatus Levybacteria bacterium]|nr:LCP family protein [Candidatus Levybacteria bacterium]